MAAPGFQQVPAMSAPAGRRGRCCRPRVQAMHSCRSHDLVGPASASHLIVASLLHATPSPPPLKAMRTSTSQKELGGAPWWCGSASPGRSPAWCGPRRRRRCCTPSPPASPPTSGEAALLGRPGMPLGLLQGRQPARTDGRKRRSSAVTANTVLPFKAPMSLSPPKPQTPTPPPRAGTSCLTCSCRSSTCSTGLGGTLPTPSLSSCGP